MNFLQLLDGAEVLAQTGNPEIKGVEYDSRRVKPGDAFVAMRGETSDGNKYIDQAIAAGAVAVVSDAEDARANLAWARVAHGRRALARASANFYKRPAERLAITGITGTNGKSTTAFILESILSTAKRKTALIGTIEYHVAGKVLPAPHTTPESLELNQIFAEAVGHGATEAVIEVSSHALEQQRVFAVPFDVAIFTNLTRDHLDYHRTMEDYFAAKRVLFEGCGTEAPRVAVLNADDQYGNRLQQDSRKHGSEVFSYGVEHGEFRAERIEIAAQGTKLDVAGLGNPLTLCSPLIGRVNVYNILAAATAAFARGCKGAEIAAGVAALRRVPGRFERVDCGQPFTVVIDYAHTDDALRNLTALARDFVREGRVLTVFGCGGDRDRSKRPLMGEAAGRGSDFVVLTSDNPRSEDPLAIMNDALVGLQRSGAKYRTQPDRRAAIALAIQEARSDDIVLIAGKGHEKLQVTNTGPIPFDDEAVARDVLSAMGYTGKIPAGRKP